MQGKRRGAHGRGAPHGVIDLKIADNTFLIMAVMPDRVGILRDVTGVIFRNGGNLTDLRQTIIGGVFSLSCVAEFAKTPDIDALRGAILAKLPERDAVVAVLPCAANSFDDPAVAGERYVASVSGPDRPGRVHMIADIFAASGVNVEDWRHDLSDRNRALTIGIVRVPAGCDLPGLQKELCEKLGKYGMATSLRHENIFRATNEVGPISALLDKTSGKEVANA